MTDSTAGEPRIVTHPAAAPAGPPTVAVGGDVPTTVVGSGDVAAGTGVAGGVPGTSAGQRGGWADWRRQGHACALSTWRQLGSESPFISQLGRVGASPYSLTTPACV